MAVVFSGKHLRVVFKGVDRGRDPFGVPVASELGSIDAPRSAGDGVAFALVAEAAPLLVEGLIAEVAGQSFDRFGRH